MTKSYAFYDVEGEHDTWHVQCEWLNETMDLQQETNVQYGIITITNLQDYWQHTSKSSHRLATPTCTNGCFH